MASVVSFGVGDTVETYAETAEERRAKREAAAPALSLAAQKRQQAAPAAPAAKPEQQPSQKQAPSAEQQAEALKLFLARPF